MPKAVVELAAMEPRKPPAVEPSPVEPTKAAVEPAAVEPATASVKAPTTSAVWGVGHRELERYGSKQQSSCDDRENPAGLPRGSITRSLSHRALLSKGCAAGS
jgi:hypothetical protein